MSHKGKIFSHKWKIISHKRIPVGLESDNRDIIFTFLLQTDPTNGNFCPSNGYVRPFVGVRLRSTDSVDSHIVSHLWDSGFFIRTIFAHRVMNHSSPNLVYVLTVPLQKICAGACHCSVTTIGVQSGDAKLFEHP